MDSLQGQLLVANGGLFDPNFRHTVVLISEHNDDGALGVVLNRPAPVSVADAVPALQRLTGDGPVFIGGPVQPQAAVVLAEFEHPDLADHVVFDSIGLLTGELDLETVSGVLRARVFAGYAGWGPGQLEKELRSLDWIIDPARAEDVFAATPERLWSSVLKRKGGEHEVLSMMPFDPTTN